jgi:hypothetical protein
MCGHHYGQSSLEQIADSERAMILDGPARYGKHHTLAYDTTVHLSRCVISIELDRSDTFGRLFSLMKKHHTLAFLSALRLHHVQTMMNLRQVFEAGAAAAYAIANPNVADFVDIDAFGIMDPTKDLTTKRYKWLKENWPAPSEWIKDEKDRINKSAGHANIVSGDRTFRVVDAGKGVSAPFFDIEDKELVEIDLWQIGSAAIGLMQLFYTVASDVARTGRAVVEFRTDFQQKLDRFGAESKVLLDELKSSDRSKVAIQRIEQRARANPKAGT